ncbi:aldo/keto reductase [Effusibacillus consociatus]|uniref:Aldo/keto reductase n=1 Tax=Effusibacillus consociatus TaxID=1117041 RepID=A0ABV9Q0L7_9BACL
MKYRRLGKTGLKVSVVGVGTWQFGGEWGRTYTQPEVDQILGKAKELGINLIDTAECYGDHLSESFIGKAIQHDRQDWIVATKFGHKFHGHLNRTDHWSPQEVLKQLENSLRALRTDYIDIYQFHSGSNEMFDQDELWTLLDKQVQAGKIRHLGISIGSNDNLYQTEASTRVNSEVIQVVYNRLDRVPEERVFPSCQKQDLGVLARVPLASGYLSGNYKPGVEFTENDVRHRHERADLDKKLQLVEEIKRTEVPEGVNMAQWALAWCLKHPAVTSVIPGCKDVAQTEANAKAAELASEDHPQAWRD